jgi:glutathione peroxidase
MKVRLLLISFMLLSLSSVISQNNKAKNIYDFEVVDIDGENVRMKDYEGKVVLIVNVASKCGLTKQYTGLEALYEKYKYQGLVILGFPCNQFMGQEPGTEEEIAEFCSANYGVTFPLFSKIEVNGDDAHPLYKYLKTQLPGNSKKADIEWNFAKFLIDKKGNPVLRFHPKVKPEELTADIEKLLAL